MTNKSAVFAALIAGLASGLLAGAVAAQEPARTLEVGVESSTETTTPPGSVPSQWAVQPCPECKYLTLDVTESTEFFVGKEPVSLEVLRSYASRETTMLDYFYDPRTLQVNRVVLRARLDATDRAPPNAQPR